MSEYVPYEQTHRLRPLLFVTTIVPDGQAESIVSIAEQNEASFCLVCRGKGTAPSEIASILTGAIKKDVVFTVLQQDKWSQYKAQLEQRFAISKMAKGIAYATPLDSVAGVSIYKMLSNTRLFEKPRKATEKGKGKKKNG